MAGRNVSVLILYKKSGEILLQHRAADAKRLPNYWALFGGGIEEGENHEDALRREIYEELEYKVKKPILVCVQKFKRDEADNSKYVFVEEFDPSQPLVLHEGQAMGWWTFNDLNKLMIVDHDREVLGEVRKFLSF